MRLVKRFAEHVGSVAVAAYEKGYFAAVNETEGQTSDALINLKRWIESHESPEDGVGYAGFDVYDVLSEVSRLIDEY